MRAQPICGAYQLMGCTAREPYKKSASSLPRSIVLLIIRIFCFLCNTHSLTADSFFFLSSTSWHLGSVLLFKPKKKPARVSASICVFAKIVSWCFHDLVELLYADLFEILIPIWYYNSTMYACTFV